jgi:hypothetical protein
MSKVLESEHPSQQTGASAARARRLMQSSLDIPCDIALDPDIMYCRPSRNSETQATKNGEHLCPTFFHTIFPCPFFSSLYYYCQWLSCCLTQIVHIGLQVVTPGVSAQFNERIHCQSYLR